MKKKFWYSLLAVLSIGLLISIFAVYQERYQEKTCTKQLFAMDTIMSFTANGDRAEEAVDAAVEEIERLDKLLSAQREDSEIGLINLSGQGPVSADTAAILGEAQKIYKTTEGLFDITIYPLMELWGFPTHQYHVPTEKEILEVLPLVDASKLVFDESKMEVKLGQGQQIDLGGIAKGYASARVMDIYQEYGIVSGQVSLGGNVQVLGEKPDKTKWKVGIQEPTGETGQVMAVLSVSNQAVITSGGYERYFEEDGNTYIHILDPHTGYPAKNELVSVTIVSENGMLADALSTSLYLMGLDKAISYWKTYGSDFDMVLLTEEGTLYVTEGIAQEIQTEKKVKRIQKENTVF